MSRMSAGRWHKQKPNNMKNEPLTDEKIVIDLTPTWQSIALFLAESATNGNDHARSELLRMAMLADLYVKQKKGDAK